MSADTTPDGAERGEGREGRLAPREDELDALRTACDLVGHFVDGGRPDPWTWDVVWGQIDKTLHGLWKRWAQRQLLHRTPTPDPPPNRTWSEPGEEYADPPEGRRRRVIDGVECYARCLGCGEIDPCSSDCPAGVAFYPCDPSPPVEEGERVRYSIDPYRALGWLFLRACEAHGEEVDWESALPDEHDFDFPAQPFSFLRAIVDDALHAPDARQEEGDGDDCDCEPSLSGKARVHEAGCAKYAHLEHEEEAR